MLKYLMFWFLGWSLAAFLAMGIDKRRAKLGMWRIPEATLFLLAFLGGAFGATLGMHLFRHKTRHWYFRWGLPLIFLAQLTLAAYLHFGPHLF